MIKKLMVFFVATMAAIGAWAATETVNGITWTYTVSGGSATITDVPTYISNQVEIPQSLNGYQVTGIGYGAFSGCNRIKSMNSLPTIQLRMEMAGMSEANFPSPLYSVCPLNHRLSQIRQSA